MGSGSTAYRITKGQSQGQIEHELAMIPIREAQATSDLGIRKLAFEQELDQAEAMNLLSQKFTGQQAQPVFAPPPVTEVSQGEQPNYTILIILGIVAVLFFKKKGKL